MSGDDDLLSLVGGELTALFGETSIPDQPEELTTEDLLASLPRKKPAEGVIAEVSVEEVPVVSEADALPAVATGNTLLYVGFDAQTKTNFQQNFSDHFQFKELFDLGQIKQLITGGDVALLVFDATSFVKPGIAITRFIKEKQLPIQIAHVYPDSKITEEYAKFKMYHIHLQPDYRSSMDEIFATINQIKKSFGLT